MDAANQVVALDGFGLNGFEFDTAVRFGLPVIGIIGNDGAWGTAAPVLRAVSVGADGESTAGGTVQLASMQSQTPRCVLTVWHPNVEKNVSD